MEMQQIRYFLSLCDELNFTRAAERCNVSQPSLTRAIKMLEEELGGALFHRERANIHLSELGRVIKPHLEQIFSGAEGAKQHAQDFIRLKKTPLRLGLMCTIAPTLLLDLIGTIRMRHPEIELRIVDAAAPKLHEGLIAGDLEVAIYAMPMVPPDERLHYLPLYREQFVIAMHAQHRLVANNAVRVKDFDGECYLSRVNCEYDEPATRIFNTQRVRCPTVYETDRDDWILAMAPPGWVSPSSRRGARPIVEPEFWREVALVTVRGRPHSPAVGALVREAMQKQWLGGPALAVAAARAMAPAI
jgi:LysR family hydrogen peroxide-inducible transcriptional activator